ncbi:MAG TPA: hypothetical protein PKA06_09320, partial [Gemmatales bacterium]|nr:hypothetical protein [Gemmatales bacterium]
MMDALGTPVCSQESPPATLEQIQAAIDFEKLPKMEGATKARATFTSLTYQAPGTFEQAAEFYRQELSKLGWKEDRSLSSSDHKQLLNLTFDKDGMCLSLSGYRSKPEDNMSITLMNFGNVDVRRFPKLDDAEIQTNQKNAVFYSTAKSADEAVKFCHQFMLNQGWKEKPNPSATVLAKEGRHVMQFQKNAMLATLVVAKGKYNKQTVTYTSSVDTTQRAGSATRQSVNSNATIPANLQDLVTLLDISKLERPAKANNVKATPIALVFESTDS